MSDDEADHADLGGNGEMPYTIANAEGDIDAIEERLAEMDRAEERRGRDEARLWEERKRELVCAVAQSVAEVFVPRMSAIERAILDLSGLVREVLKRGN